MTPEAFRLLRDAIERTASELLVTKGNDYTRDVDQDRLGNFKDVAARVGLTPIQVWSVYFQKHIASIERFVRDGRVQSESITSRFIDARNYLDLGAALIAEQQPSPSEGG